MIEPTAMSDEELAERCRKGELGAFSELVDRHRRIVFRVAARIVGRDEADDVTQDAFLRAYNRIGDWQGRGTFRSWLLQITRNAALNELARRRPEPGGSGTEVEESAPSGGDLGVRTPAAALEESERRDRLELKLGDLRDEHRVVLVLRDLEGLSYGEIANATASPLGSVKGRLHRARAELIAAMRANTYDWELPG